MCNGKFYVSTWFNQASGLDWTLYIMCTQHAIHHFYVFSRKTNLRISDFQADHQGEYECSVKRTDNRYHKTKLDLTLRTSTSIPHYLVKCLQWTSKMNLMSRTQRFETNRNSFVKGR